jgi:riboflavin synthase
MGWAGQGEKEGFNCSVTFAFLILLNLFSAKVLIAVTVKEVAPRCF